jgi:nicotinamidase/pyrazinamidase
MAGKRALLVVDVQNDFCPGGSLGVSGGHEIVPVLNEYARRFHAEGSPVIATRDWHPPQTRHFQAQGGPWPPHCVQGTPGAEFHPELRLPEGTEVVSKGMDPNEDSYSAFDAYTRTGQTLPAYLRALDVDEIYIGGLATDYCVRATTLDALSQGFRVTVLTDAIRGVDVRPGDSERALREMVDAGARTATLETVFGAREAGQRRRR